MGWKYVVKKSACVLTRSIIWDKKYSGYETISLRPIYGGKWFGIAYLIYPIGGLFSAEVIPETEFEWTNHYLQRQKNWTFPPSRLTFRSSTVRGKFAREMSVYD